MISKKESRNEWGLEGSLLGRGRRHQVQDAQPLRAHVRQLYVRAQPVVALHRQLALLSLVLPSRIQVIKGPFLFRHIERFKRFIELYFYIDANKPRPSKFLP